jgi:pyrimidine operon attenuation protein / uracil phosphoribosyltransferase
MTQVLQDASAIAAAVSRLAQGLAENPEPPVLIGIRTHGVPLAARLAEALVKRGIARPELGAVDITLYRDDLAGRPLPQVRGSEIPVDLEGRRVVLVDDVLFTGRTVRSALLVLAEFGRPRRVELCVLVDRGHRELPICADHVGFGIETQAQDDIRVRLTEAGAPVDQIIRT